MLEVVLLVLGIINSNSGSCIKKFVIQPIQPKKSVSRNRIRLIRINSQSPIIYRIKTGLNTLAVYGQAEQWSYSYSVTSKEKEEKSIYYSSYYSGYYSSYHLFRYSFSIAFSLSIIALASSSLNSSTIPKDLVQTWSRSI